jgi:predicted permease
VTPAVGRFFDADEDRPGAPHVAVLGYHLWRTRFGGERSVLGREIRIADEPYTIVGVAPADFTGVESTPADLFLPVEGARVFGDAHVLTDRNYYWLRIIGRLRPGATPAQASAEVTAIYRHASEGNTAVDQATFARAVVTVMPLMDYRRRTRSPNASVSLWLGGMAAVLLVIACANVANLCLARSAREARSIAVRVALGAGRARLVRLLLSEMVLLAALSAAAGFALSLAGSAVLRRSLLANVAPPDHLIDARLLGAGLLAAAVTVLLAGLGPALLSSRVPLVATLKSGGHGTTSSHTRLRKALLALQLALVCVLLIGTGVFSASLRNARAVDLGFDPDHLLLAHAAFPNAGITGPRVDEITRRIVDRVRALPGVTRVAAAEGGPFLGSVHLPPSVPGRDSIPTVRALQGRVAFEIVSPELFSTAGITTTAGRVFTDADAQSGRRVVVVSERLARAYWPGENPLGQCVYVAGHKVPCSEVIGVVRDRRGITTDRVGAAEYYIPIGHPDAPAEPHVIYEDRSIIIRASIDPAALVPQVSRIMRAELPTLQLIDVRPATELLEPTLHSWRLGATMFGLFGVLAAVLAMLGLYGVVSYTVSQRTQEIGVRMVLGAEGADIARLVVGEAVRVTLVAIATGLAMAALGGHALAALLFEVSTHDPVIYALTALTTGLTAIAASYLPARRAARVEPVTALRAE